MRFRESQYEKMRSWLEENPVTREEFVKLTSPQLNRAKGDEWQREGLFVQNIRQAQTTREEFIRQAASVPAQPKRQRRKRFTYKRDNRGRLHKVDSRTGRYAKFTKHDRGVKKSSPTQDKKGAS